MAFVNDVALYMFDDPSVLIQTALKEDKAIGISIMNNSM